MTEKTIAIVGLGLIGGSLAGALMDSEGYLPYEATGDGVHLEPPYCVKWTDYLRTHTAQ